MKVKYIGDYYKVYLQHGEIYEATLVDNHWYEIYDEDDQDSYRYPITSFEVVEE